MIWDFYTSTYLGVSHGCVLQSNAGDPLPSRLDNILAPVLDSHVAMAIDGRNVACVCEHA